MIVHHLIVVTVASLLLAYCVEGTVTVIKGGGTTFPQQPYSSAVADFNRLYRKTISRTPRTRKQDSNPLRLGFSTGVEVILMCKPVWQDQKN
ncbi:hypothetical protein BCR33DRAFT_721591 [Rhizoclosmatium globosum]|uniref:Secreted protein n=1 Tax=Rhizoclosmatium globosum TaxID=329046 RepID=A0A1Y2BRI0_9FUNG|nr:hypothetical protein BCR33DRAFT_721591 [Rhizoclosmatium globosum]|eukprot:ORY37237.1 hypothetical protein BCR33DRAFT_721591 [Rhizoclosmatium globosum]